MTEDPPEGNLEAQEELAPYPGSKKIPRWDLGELPEPPSFAWCSKAIFFPCTCI